MPYDREMAHERDQYAALSDRDLVETAKNALQSTLTAKDPGTREQRIAVHDGAVHELKLRLFEYAAIQCGLTPAPIPVPALALFELDL